MAEDRFDPLFLNVARQHQGIEPLLESFFGFLRRRTDFFTGGSEGQAQRAVLECMKRQEQIARKELASAKARVAAKASVGSLQVAPVRARKRDSARAPRRSGERSYS